jgi:hypothetical protein
VGAGSGGGGLETGHAIAGINEEVVKRTLYAGIAPVRQGLRVADSWAVPSIGIKQSCQVDRSGMPKSLPRRQSGFALFYCDKA